MKKMKMPTSDSYRESLIESLKDAEHAGAFIGAILEEKDPEPALLRNAIRKASAGSEIYCFVELLEALGFKLEITVADIELPT